VDTLPDYLEDLTQVDLISGAILLVVIKVNFSNCQFLGECGQSLRIDLEQGQHGAHDENDRAPESGRHLEIDEIVQGGEGDEYRGLG